MNRIVTIHLDSYQDAVMFECLLRKTGCWTSFNREDQNNTFVSFGCFDNDIEEYEE